MRPEQGREQTCLFLSLVATNYIDNIVKIVYSNIVSIVSNNRRAGAWRS